MDVAELLAAQLQEFVTVFDLDLVQGLEAIGGESRAHDIDRLDATLDQLVQHGGGIRLNPGLFAEARLVADLPVRRVQFELRRQQLCSLFALLLVGVAAVDIRLRQAME